MSREISRFSTGLALSAALFATACSGSEKPLQADPIDSHLLGYTSQEGRAIAYDQFKLGRAALLDKGFSQVKATTFVYVPYGSAYRCDEEDMYVSGKQHDAFYVGGECDDVVIAQGLIDGLDVLIKPPKNRALAAETYPINLRIVVGHELGHAVLPEQVQYPHTVEEQEENIDGELHADCIGGQLLHETKPAQAAWLLRNKLYNWVDVEGDAVTHGDPISRSFKIFDGLSGIDCISDHAVHP